MTTETVCVPRDELSELLEDGVDDYWITTEDGARVVEILRAILAQPVVSEPVAWANWKVGTKSYVPYRNKEAAERCVRQSEIAAAQEGPYEVVPLYRHQPAPVIPEGYALVPIEPTEAMRDAGNIYSLNRATLMRIWADMLGAAQQPTEGSTDE